MQVAMLGPLEVRDGDRLVAIAGARLRRLLLRLAVDAGRVVSTGELVDAVWAGEHPADVPNALQTLISRLRRAVGDGALIQQLPGGYRLTVEPEDVDATRFVSLADRGRAALAGGDHDEAAVLLREALALWRGAALADADDAEYAIALAHRWQERRLDATADRIDADLALGRAAEVTVELAELVATNLLRERFTGQLMTALTATGRAAEALAAYERLRKLLADQLGTDPSSDLQQQHLALLRGQTQPAPTPQRRHRTNLHTALTSFIGRDDDAARVNALLDTGRLVTIVGPGGAGKTRLSAEVAAGRVDSAVDGVWFVPLAPVTDDAAVAPTILAALGLREHNLLDRQAERHAHDAMDRLVESLADSTCLLVIDNCEHLIDGVASLVDKLLANCPKVRVLATSREPLGIDGESLCALSSLGLPAEGADPALALTCPSVRLFAERAAAVHAEFTVDQQTVEAVVEIVRRLDGLPLPIELAAARLRVLPVIEVAARLSDRFALLTGGKRTALPRHRTLRAVVQWSWDLLTSHEQLLAERLTVFPAGASPEGAQAVCADDRLPRAEIPELLHSLVDKSLLQITGDGALRYRMLETIREFGVEQLAGRGEITAARRAHADYFRGLITTAEPLLRTREQLPWLALLSAERDNVLGALRFLGDSGDADAALELALALTWYWTLLGSHSEAATWLGYALAIPGSSDPERRTVAEAMHAVNSFALEERGDETPESLSERWRSIITRLDLVDLTHEPVVVSLRPMLAYLGGNEELAQNYLTAAASSPEPWVRAAAHMFRASLAENAGDVDSMRADLELALSGFSRIGDRWGLATTLGARGQLRTLDGELTGAVEDYEQGAAFLSELGAAYDANMMRLRLLGVRIRLGDVTGARAEARRVEEETAGRPQGERLFVELALAGIAQAAGDWDELRRRRSRAEQLIDAHQPWNPVLGHAQAMYLAVIASVDVEDGELDSAHQRLRSAYEVAITTRDMPIVSFVGVAIAALVLARGRAAEAAELLGAAARLRGSDDLTDLPIKRLRAALHEQLGADFDDAYQRGRVLSRDTALARLDPTGWADPNRAS